MPKASCRQIKGFIKEELMASREYKSLGYISLAKDEASHAKFFERIKKKKCSKK